MKRCSRIEVAERRKSIADLALKGWSQTAIAAHLHIAQATVARDLEDIKRQWRESAIRDFDEAREQEIRKMDLVETEAWAGWLRSQGPVQAASMTEGKDGSRRSSSLKHQYGNPRFLERYISRTPSPKGTPSGPTVISANRSGSTSGPMIACAAPCRSIRARDGKRRGLAITRHS